MRDYQLQTLLQSALIAGLAARGITAGVKQNNQPRQFVAPSTPTVFHSLGSRKKYGWPARVDTFNTGTGNFDTTTTQVVHTRFQVAGYVPNISPADATALTSGDLVSAASDILQHEDALAVFRASDCNVFRVTDNPLIWLQDSSAQNIAWASFDIIFTHKDAFVTSTGVITDFNPDFDRV